jgi:hypothetical protein
VPPEIPCGVPGPAVRGDSPPPSPCAPKLASTLLGAATFFRFTFAPARLPTSSGPFTGVFATGVFTEVFATGAFAAGVFATGAFAAGVFATASRLVFGPAIFWTGTFEIAALDVGAFEATGVALD